MDEQAVKVARDEIYNRMKVPPGKKVRLKDYNTSWDQNDELKGMGKEAVKELANAALARNTEDLKAAQELLWADNTRSVLVILQGIDAAGKDGIIKHVMSGVNPAGCQVISFKPPSEEELDHTFLWRHMKAVPAKGMIGIFNRSHYEEVLVVKVHPEMLVHEHLHTDRINKDFWEGRYYDINAFERHLVRNGTVVLKFFLNISKEEQRERFIERLGHPEKQWKFSLGDVRERDFWDEYMEAFEDMLNRTSTEWAPWYVVPSDHKWAARSIVAEVLTTTIQNLGLKFPAVPKEDQDELERIRMRLEGEGKNKGQK